MEPQLLFLYIHKYRNIEQQGFNLSSSYEIEFDAGYDDDGAFHSPSLSLVCKNERIGHLFDPAISDIKGVIGENGAGKSTLLQYLAFQCHRHPDYMEYPKCNRDIIVYSQPDHLGKMHLYIAAGSEWRANETLKHSGFDAFNSVQVYNVDDLVWGELPHFNTDVVYYSNVFDNRSENNYNGLKNISTNFLARHDMERYLNGSPLKRPIMSQLVVHSFQEDNRRLSFALKFRGLLPFTLPDHVVVYYNRTVNFDLKKKAEGIPGAIDGLDPADARTQYLVSINELLNKWLEKTKILEQQVGPQLRQHLHKQYFDYFILSHILDDNEMIDQYFPEYPQYKLDVFQLIIDGFDPATGIADVRTLADKVETLEKVINRKEGRTVQLGDSELTRPLRHFGILDHLFRTRYDDPKSHFQTGFKLAINDQLLDMHEQYFRTLHVNGYLDFNFPGMSSGELGFLTLYSRFYSLVSIFQKGDRLEQSSVLVLIDEGDLYFHPKWQVLFLSYLNKMFSIMFQDKKVQLILTSHSPFIASDLPTSNLLFLKKGTEKSRLPISRESAINKGLLQDAPDFTFGANVHELLADSFFLEGAHIGQLAKSTIYQIIDQLEGVAEKNLYNSDEMLNIITQVGEPWVRSKLLEKYEKAYPNTQAL